MVKKKTEETGKVDDSKTYAFLATFLSIIGFVIALVTKKDDKYVKYYAKQGLVVFITSIVLWIILAIITAIIWHPTALALVYGYGGTYTIVVVLRWIVWIVVLLMWLLSWLNALSGVEKEVPVVGKFAEKFNF